MDAVTLLMKSSLTALVAQKVGAITLLKKFFSHDIIGRGAHAPCCHQSQKPGKGGCSAESGHGSQPSYAWCVPHACNKASSRARMGSSDFGLNLVTAANLAMHGAFLLRAARVT
eukprot:scaffold87624_cov22-Tisochrysis_lutea.AAC.3